MKDGFFGLLDLYISMFHERGEESFSFLCKNALSKKILLTKYKSIEQISDKERKGLYRYVIEKFPELSNPEKKQAAFIIHTIGTII